MNVINVRNVEGFTLVDNFYQIPESMSVEGAQEIVAFHDVEGMSWSEFDRRLAAFGIVPVEVPIFDVEF